MDTSADAGNVKAECFSFFEERTKLIKLRAGVGTGTGVVNVKQAGGIRR
jgi:hypothetical protein